MKIKTARLKTPPGDTDPQTFVKKFGDVIRAAGEQGCGYEGTLEAWYRFLIDPEPPQTIAVVDGKSVPQGIDQKKELDRATALMAALDAVVSAPTAVSWLSAGAGVPTFKILYDNSWTALGQAYEPFAPSCVCVMPQTRGDWADVFQRAKAKLA